MINKAIFILCLSILAGVLGQLVLKKGTFRLPPFSFVNLHSFIIEILTNYYFLLWVIFGGISAFLWILVVSDLNLSFALPVAQAGSIILVVIFSLVFFSETVSVYQWTGIFLIIMGMFLVGK